MNPTMLIAMLVIAISTGGCGSSLLPSTDDAIRSPWREFEEVKTAYDKIIPYETTKDDLIKVGFDPFTTPNIEILTYLTIIRNFMPNPSIKKEDLAKGLQDCIAARESCVGYRFFQKTVEEQRSGNVMLDLFGFKRKIETTGWEFRTVIVLINDVVVYKVWGGKPKVETTKKKKKPLGPLQKMDELILDTAF